MSLSKIRSVLMVLVLVLMIGFAAGCGEPEETVDPPVTEPDPVEEYGGTVVWRLAGEIHTLNPVLGADGVTGMINQFTREFLGGVDFDGEWDGRLAESFDVSDDGLTYTFYLRQGVTWHDGHPFTADDVIFTFELALVEEAAFPQRPRMFIDDEPITWKKVDDYTVTMHLPQASATVLENIRVPIAPKHLLEDVDPAEFDTCEWARNPVTTGPFKFAEHRTGEYVRLERNEDYWGGKPFVEEIVLQIVPDISAAKVALQTGEIDVSTINPMIAEELRGDDRVNIYQAPGTTVQFLCMNNKMFPFDDASVRRAMNYAVNREAIANTVYLGYATPAYSPFAASVLYHNEDVVIRYPFDLDKAADILEEAGFEPGSDGILQRDGEKLDFELHHLPGDDSAERALLVFQSDLDKLGVRAELLSIEQSAYVAMITAGTDPLPYQMTLNSYGPGVDPDGYSIVWHSSGYPAGLHGWNYVGYTNPAVDEMFEAGKSELNPVARAYYYEEIQRIVSEDAAVAPIAYHESVQATTSRIDFGDSGLQPNLERRFPRPELMRVIR